MSGIYANIGGILMVNVTIYSSTMDPMGMELESETLSPRAGSGEIFSKNIGVLVTIQE